MVLKYYYDYDFPTHPVSILFSYIQPFSSRYNFYIKRCEKKKEISIILSSDGENERALLILKRENFASKKKILKLNQWGRI